MEPYSYVGNNPIMFTDPTGMSKEGGGDGECYVDNDIRINSETGEKKIIKTNDNFDRVFENGKFVGLTQKGYFENKWTNNGIKFQYDTYPDGVGMGAVDNAILFLAGELSFKYFAEGVKYLWALRGANELKGFSIAAEYGIQSYSALKKMTKGKGLEVHHLIEQRFANTLGINPNSMQSIVLTKAEHKVFTNAWRTKIGYEGSKSAVTTSTASKEQILQAAKEIYKDHPVILKALGL